MHGFPGSGSLPCSMPPTDLAMAFHEGEQGIKSLIKIRPHDPAPVIFQPVRLKTHEHAGEKPYGAPQSAMRIRLHFSPDPPGRAVFQMIEFVESHEVLDTRRQILSHISGFPVLRSIAEPWVQVFLALVDYLGHPVFHGAQNILHKAVTARRDSNEAIPG